MGSHIHCKSGNILYRVQAIHIVTTAVNKKWYRPYIYGLSNGTISDDLEWPSPVVSLWAFWNVMSLQMYRFQLTAAVCPVLSVWRLHALTVWRYFKHYCNVHSLVYNYRYSPCSCNFATFSCVIFNRHIRTTIFVVFWMFVSHFVKAISDQGCDTNRGICRTLVVDSLQNYLIIPLWLYELSACIGITPPLDCVWAVLIICRLRRKIMGISQIYASIRISFVSVCVFCRGLACIFC